MRATIFRKLDKAELHLHFEGAVPSSVLLRWSGRAGLSVQNQLTVGDRSPIDFDEFIGIFKRRLALLADYSRIRDAAEAVAARLVDENVIYAELHFSPGAFRRLGLEPARVAVAIADGMRRVPTIQFGLIADLVRGYGPAFGSEVLNAVVPSIAEAQIVAIGLGGRDTSYPGGVFESIFQKARDFGLRTTLHIGESAPPATVLTEVRLLRPDRVGHATTAANDLVCARELASLAVPVEVCLSSNLHLRSRLGGLDDPLLRFIDVGVPVVISTDDPDIFNTDLTNEFHLAMKHLHVPPATLVGVARRSFETAFLQPSAKSAFLLRFDRTARSFGWLESSLASSARPTVQHMV